MPKFKKTTNPKISMLKNWKDDKSGDFNAQMRKDETKTSVLKIS